MQKIYGTYRPERLVNPENYPDGITRNGTYHPATYLNFQYSDWNSAGLTNCMDGAAVIPEERYTGEIAPGVKKLTRLIVGEYAEGVDPILFGENVAKVGAKWNIEIFPSVEEAREWVRNNTDLVEDPQVPGKFLISEATTGMMGEEVPARYLVID